MAFYVSDADYNLEILEIIETNWMLQRLHVQEIRYLLQKYDRCD